ncbi:Poly(A) polymerase pla1 [Pleurostoma richardsiae]|uniref:Poly(A) polymerase n=1 Tax=Pleurostoma richardsiae TaxID=41990 RepID=A0AA38S858_9PEZI|nr:Poly(A) polymerase pla1 [Pleurostoma richardsiae]
MDSERQLGPTPPISTSLPTEAEKQATDSMVRELRAQGTFEHASDTQKREKVLDALQDVANVFVKKVAKEKEPENTTLHRDARGIVFTYGSYRLGVFGPGSDIDTLVVAPRYVTREDFFQYFPDLLFKMSPAGAITDLTAVTDAFVPIIKFEYSGISIDLIFSRIATQKQLPPKDSFTLLDNNVLRGLDEAELRSLNGTRVTDEILQLVPEIATFRVALRAIKLWAQRRAIYANIMGFPGGVAWAMLVARICQLYPKATGAVIVNKFFHIMRRWPWPQPVLLKTMSGDGPLSVRVWNPKLYKGDQYHLMPIITPAYPQMCATFNVTKSSLAVIQRELDRFTEVTDQIMIGKRPWKDLFVKHTFFTADFKYYIAVITMSTSKEAHKQWSGFVESKVRLLVQGVERHQSVALARPFNKGIERVHRCKSSEAQLVMDGSLAFVVKDTDSTGTKVKAEAGGDKGEGTATTDIKPEPETPSKVKTEDIPDVGEEASVELYTTTHYIGLEFVKDAKSLDLSYYVNDFKNLCHAWDKYQDRNEHGQVIEGLHKYCHLSVQHVRNIHLPDDVFEPGEVKPTKPLKKKTPAPAPAPAPGANAVAAKKRNAPDEPVPTAKRQQTSAVAAG